MILNNITISILYILVIVIAYIGDVTNNILVYNV